MNEKQYGLDDLPNQYTTSADIENERLYRGWIAELREKKKQGGIE